jgi:hypothetical protein
MRLPAAFGSFATKIPSHLGPKAVSSSSATPVTPCFLVRDHSCTLFICRADRLFSFLPNTDQGQGGGQSVEDAEALGALLAGLTRAQSSQIPERLKLVEEIRIERASKIQGYSREKALGARDGGTFTLNAGEFSAYNYSYYGALDWAKKMGIIVVDERKAADCEGSVKELETKGPAELLPTRQALASLVTA